MGINTSLPNFLFMKHLGTMTEMFVLGSYEVCVEEVVCVYDTMYTYQLHNVESSNDK